MDESGVNQAPPSLFARYFIAPVTASQLAVNSDVVADPATHDTTGASGSVRQVVVLLLPQPLVLPACTSTSYDSPGFSPEKLVAGGRVGCHPIAAFDATLILHRASRRSPRH